MRRWKECSYEHNRCHRPLDSPAGTALFNGWAVSVAAFGKVIPDLDLLVLFIVRQIFHACRIFVFTGANCSHFGLTSQ
jgi:hypothetical protein